jgi:hypothetical protein
MFKLEVTFDFDKNELTNQRSGLPYSKVMQQIDHALAGDNRDFYNW